MHYVYYWTQWLLQAHLLAMQKKSQKVTVAALERVLSHSSVGSGKRLVVLRCLVRLRAGMLLNAGLDQEYGMVFSVRYRKLFRR